MKQISLYRIFLLIKRYIYVYLKTYLIGFAAAGVTMLMLSIIITWSNNGEYNHISFQNQMQVVVVICGYIITSTIFKEINSKHSGWFYTMLPANPSEKVLSYWSLSSIGYIIVASIAMILVSILTSLVTIILFKTNFYVYNPFCESNVFFMVNYCIFQSIFFLGAIYFKKNNFIKTILAIMLFVTALIVVVGVVNFLLFEETSIKYVELVNENKEGKIALKYVAEFVYYGLLVPFMLIVSYFRIKEREV